MRPEPLRRGTHLRAPRFGELEVGAAEIADTGVADGFTVANEHEPLDVDGSHLEIQSSGLITIPVSSFGWK
jgi:hypothetical protein